MERPPDDTLFASRRFLALIFLLFACCRSLANPYLLYVANLALIYIILAIGLNLLLGYSGHIAFANAAMFGIGAYAAGLLQVRSGRAILGGLPAAGVVAMLVGTTITWPALRMSGIYLAHGDTCFRAVHAMGLQQSRMAHLRRHWLHRAAPELQPAAAQQHVRHLLFDR